MSRTRRSLIAAAALAPFVAAVVTAAIPTQPAPLAPAGELPALAFDQYAVNFREVPPRPVIQAHFDFTNRGDRPVRILQLEPSCGCLNPQLYDGQTHYEPGERGRFYVTLQTANESPGPHGYTVTVHYQDPQPREETVAFQLTLPERKVSVEPPEVYFYQLSGEPSEQIIYVTDYRDTGLRVLNASSRLEHLTVKVMPAEHDEEGHQRTPILLRVPGDVPPGRHTGLVTITTTDPDFREIYAAVLVHGPTEVRPASFESSAP